MNGLTKLAIKRPVASIIVVLAILVFGVMSIMGMPQELMPEMELPMLIVSTPYPGAGPEDVEKLVSREIEGAIGSLSGVKSFTSNSQENYSMVIVTYEYGTNMDIAYTDLKERLDRIRSDLPTTTVDPTIIALDLNAMATISLSVSSESQPNLLYFTEDQIVPEFEKLSAVADVSVFGGQEQYIKVELMEEKMQQYGVSMSSVVSAVSSADFSIPSGTADYGSQSLNVRSAVEYKSAEALRNIPIPMGQGNVIRLSDVANIYVNTKDADSLSRFNGVNDISLSIQKRQSASAVDVSRQVMKAVETLKSEHPDTIITVTQDNSVTIQDSINSVASTLVMGVILSMIVLFFFLGDLKASLIVGSSMPISLLVTFILMNLMGFSMNVVTMSAMVLGVGMMVDNSIVVLDSCFKTKSKETSFVEAAIEGTKFVLLSVAAGTLTTVVVFFPLASLPGMSGQMFKPLGFTIIFSLTASLFSAVTLVPLFFTKFKPTERKKAPAAKMLKGLERGYTKLMRKLLKKKKTVVTVSVALVVISVLLATQLNFELMPSMDEGIISITMETRPGLKLERINELAGGLEEMVASHPDTDHYTMSAGGSGLSSMMGGGGAATVTAYLKDKRAMKTADVIEQFQRETATLLDCDITVESSSSSSMSMTSSGVDINLEGNELEPLKEAAAQVKTLMKDHPDILAVTSTVEDASPQAKVVVDSMKAAAAGFSPIQVATNINMAMSGKETVSIRDGDQKYTIWVEYPADKYVSVGDLSNMIMVSPSGASVPLLDVASIEFSDSPQTITRQNSQYRVTVTGTPTKAAKLTAEKELTLQVQSLDLPSGVSLAQSRQQESMNEEFSALGMAIIVAVLLVFMVMAIQFESVKYSIMVMICIPFSLIGSFLMLFAANLPISMTSLLGFLVLVGTVVNNGILFVDTTNQYRNSMTVETALISAGRNRMRSILMTTLTTVLSMLPMALGIGEGAKMMQGLGVVVIGGLTASTILTLLLLPSFYLIMEGNPDKKNKRHEKRRIKEDKRQVLEEANGTV